MTKYTPGPWRYLRYDNMIISEAIPGRIADIPVTVRSLHVSEAEREANAILMAAAPDLLTAIINSDDAHWTPAMRAAMKKALGEDQ